MKIQTARAMSGNLENIDSQTKQVLAVALLHNQVRLNDLDAQRKTVPFEKTLFGNHRHSVGMANNRTAVSSLESGRICHVIPVTMGENQQADFFIGKMTVRPLGGIEKHLTLRCLDQKAIRLVTSTGKSFELKHGNDVESTLLIFLAQHARQGDQLPPNA
jgi:hypothetical protein